MPKFNTKPLCRLAYNQAPHFIEALKYLTSNKTEIHFSLYLIHVIRPFGALARLSRHFWQESRIFMSCPPLVTSVVASLVKDGIFVL
jgi:hypothetical protein